MSNMTDHFPIFTHISDSFQSVQSPRRKTRRLNTENIIRLKDRLSQIDWEEVLAIQSCNESFNKFIQILMNVYDDVIPEQTPNESNYKKTPQSPWVTRSLIKCINKKNSLFYKYIHNPSPQTRLKYTKYKKHSYYSFKE